MNEPPVGPLPSWQMAQDRQGHRGLGGGACGDVCLHVSERGREREGRREGSNCSEGRSGIPVSFYHDKGDLRHTREECESHMLLGHLLILSTRIYFSPKWTIFEERTNSVLGYIYFTWISEIHPQVKSSWKVPERLFKPLAVTRVAVQH